MIKEYPILLFVAIFVGCCSYFCVKKVGCYYDSGKTPYLTRNLYVIGPSLVLFASLLIFNLCFGIVGLGGIYKHYFEKNNFENIARKMDAVDDNLNNSSLSISEKKLLLTKKEIFIKNIESGSLNNAVKVDLGLSHDDLYGSKNHNKELISMLNKSLAKQSLE